MIIKIQILLIILFLCFVGCSGFETISNNNSIKIGDKYITTDKKYWLEKIFPNFNPSARVQYNNISYNVGFDTNFVIYYIETRDPDFSTQEGVFPGMSYDKIKKEIKDPKIEWNLYSEFDLFSTNTQENSSKIFFIQLQSGWVGWFHGEYDKAIKKPDDKDYIEYLIKGTSKHTGVVVDAVGEIEHTLPTKSNKICRLKK